MRYLKMNRIEENMILGKPVYDENMNLLLGGNKQLSKCNIQKLKQLGYGGLYIIDELTESDEFQDVVSETLRKKAKDSLRRLDMDAVIYYSNEIVEELRNNPSICIDLIEIRNYDDYTYSHSVNVSILATIIGIGLGLNDNDLRAVSLGGLLHDVGKIRIPLEILNKPAKLSTEEYQLIKTHPNTSYELIRDNPSISSSTKVAVRLHHENEDGTGYPNGLTSPKIYLLAKILHVADVYDALTSKRPYKDAFIPSDAIEYLMGNCGSMFEHSVVSTFIQYVSPYPLGIEVELSNGETAIVVKSNPQYPLRPIVKALGGKRIDLKSVLNITIIKVLC